MSFFSSFLYKIGVQEGRTGLAWWVVTNMYVKIPFATIPGMGEGCLEENDGESEFQWYMSHIVRIFVNATIYSYPSQQQK
jgi:hypothetical protein